MAKRPPGGGVWLGLASEPQPSSDDVFVSANWGRLWGYGLGLARRTPATEPAAAPAPDAANRPAPPSPDSVSATSQTGFDAPVADPASLDPHASAAAAASTTVTRSGNQYIDGVLSGFKWNGPVTYSFPDAPSDYANPYTGGDFEPTDPGFQQVSTAQMQAVRHFLEGIAGGPGSIYDPVEGFSNLSVTELPVGSGGADIMIAQSPTANPTAYGYYPGNLPADGDVWFGNNFDYRSPVLGSYEYVSHLHEVGHALGLKHGNETDVFGALPADRDDLEFSVMTYRSYLGGPTGGSYSNEEFGYPQTYMMSDVAALQYLYGADFAYNSGNTTYTWSTTTGEMFVNGIGQGAPGGGIGGAADRVFLTIWDGGGIDTYDMSNYTTAVTIDLRAGQWSLTASNQRADLGNNHFAQGTVYNAYEVNGSPASLIENATGGPGGDNIVGNEAANTLTGNAGDDTISGNSGNDTIFGGAGTDQVVFVGPRSGYTAARGSDGSVMITANNGSDGTDTIFDVEQYKFADRAAPYTLDEILGPASSGGRWIFSVAGTPVVLGINNGAAPVFPTPQTSAFNIEVFTNANISGVPNPESGFQSSIVDPAGSIDSGFLTGTDLHLGSGNFLAVDSLTGAANQSASQITLGSGNQTVVGAKSDTLIGGQAPAAAGQVLSALLGNETVIGGTAGAESIWGGANDSILAGSGANQQIVVSGAGTTVIAGIGGNATIAALAQNTIRSLPGSTENVVVAAAANDVIDLTGNGGLSGVIGANGDTITGGSGTSNIEGAAGGMLIKIGAAGTTALSGSTTPGARNTVTGGAGGFNFNPSAVVGSGDLIDLSGGGGTATINAFAFGANRIAAPDTILATNNADSIFGGGGDRIGTGSGSVVGGSHQWSHADTLAGSSVGFGSNDTVASTTYIGTTAVRGTVPGTSSAQVTVGGFDATSDFLFYQNENATTSSAIVATSQAAMIGGAASTIVTLPDGTVMTLVGVTQAQLQSALVIGTLFKA
jgi:serralysin